MGGGERNKCVLSLIASRARTLLLWLWGFKWPREASCSTPCNLSQLIPGKCSLVPQHREASCNGHPLGLTMLPQFTPVSDPCAAGGSWEVGDVKGILQSEEFTTHVLPFPPVVFLFSREPNSQNQKANWVSHGARASGFLNFGPIRLWPFLFIFFLYSKQIPCKVFHLGGVVLDALLLR